MSCVHIIWGRDETLKMILLSKGKKNLQTRGQVKLHNVISIVKPSESLSHRQLLLTGDGDTPRKKNPTESGIMKWIKMIAMDISLSFFVQYQKQQSSHGCRPCENFQLHFNAFANMRRRISLGGKSRRRQKNFCCVFTLQIAIFLWNILRLDCCRCRRVEFCEAAVMFSSSYSVSFESLAQLKLKLFLTRSGKLNTRK